MKIIFLNVWGGKVYEPLMEFVEESARDTDFFCFQEVFDSPLSREVSWGGRADMLTEIIRILPDFQYRYTPMAEGCDGDEMTDSAISWGLGTFARADIRIDTYDVVPVGAQEVMHGVSPHPHERILQCVRFVRNGTRLTIAHFHGTAYPGSKLDSPERLAQSQKIVEFLNNEKGEKILGGDFNLTPETESVRMIERVGMRNLIKEFRISTTRNVFSWARYPEAKRQYFSDYVFVSPGIRVLGFAVPELSISDHLPLTLEIA